MLSWVPFAMVRIVLFLAAGILLGIYYPELIDSQTLVSLDEILCVLFFISFFLLRSKRILKPVSGTLGLVFVFLFGYLHLQLNTQGRSQDHLLNEKDRIVAYEAIVRTAPESKARSWKIQAEVVQIKTNQWKQASGLVMIYISKKSIDKVPWLYGDRLLIKGSPNELTSPANPEEFNFKRFLSFRNIYHQQFITADQIKFIDHAQRNGFLYYSHLVRAWASDVLKTYIPGEQQQAIAMALVLGVTEGIDTDLQSAYAASGAMHVLAVSGLHVGIIYAIILLLFKPLNRYAWSRWVIAVISILLLWTFAFVTGLSPSVLRAVTMFSFIALARPLGWRTNIYNTLAASAFVLLLYNPYLIMSVGFQLSYLAVLGIVYLQRPIYNLIEIDSRVGDWIWQITCVSIAAQIATFALGMLYFHQFPVYFLISNLFVIPLATLVLVGGILLLMVSSIYALATLLGIGLQALIQLLNWLVFKTEALPFSLISEIYLTTFQCWLIMGILLFLVGMIQYRSIKGLYGGMLFMIILIFTQFNHFQQDINQKQFVIYSVSGHSAMEWIDHGVSYFKSDSLLSQDKERIRFHIRPNRLKHGVTSINTSIPFGKEIAPDMEIYLWQNSKILFVSNGKVQLPQHAKIDYLVVAKNSIPVDTEIDRLGVKKLILDGSNSQGYINRWRQSSDSMRVHVVMDKGAFILNE
jgi:competence protein ComEC